MKDSNNREITIGLTGNIGAGKTTIAAVFQEFGVPVFDADKVGRWLLDTDQDIKDGLIKIFGKDILTDNLPDRKKIANLVFSDGSLLVELNKLIHPRVGEVFREWRQNQMAKVVIREAAILIESGTFRDLDKLIVVTCPENIRLKRVMERDQSNESEVRARMNKQMNEEEKVALADFVIINDGKTLVVPQVLDVLRKLKINN